MAPRAEPKGGFEPAVGLDPSQSVLLLLAGYWFTSFLPDTNFT